MVRVWVGMGGPGRPTGISRIGQAGVGLKEIPVGGSSIHFYTRSYQARQVGCGIWTSRPGMGWAKYPWVWPIAIPRDNGLTCHVLRLMAAGDHGLRLSNVLRLAGAGDILSQPSVSIAFLVLECPVSLIDGFCRGLRLALAAQ
jgi:hypothetical protein